MIKAASRKADEGRANHRLTDACCESFCGELQGASIEFGSGVRMLLASEFIPKNAGFENASWTLAPPGNLGHFNNKAACWRPQLRPMGTRECAIL